MNINVMLDVGAKMPTKAHDTDAGFDIYTPFAECVPPHESRKIYTGVHMEIPEGYVGFLKSKSGLNVNHGIRCEGVVDAGFTGGIVAKLYNDSDEPKFFEKGEKITQIVILPIPDVTLALVDEFKPTERGNNGFGSSGKF